MLLVELEMPFIRLDAKGMLWHCGKERIIIWPGGRVILNSLLPKCVLEQDSKTKYSVSELMASSLCFKKL